MNALYGCTVVDARGRKRRMRRTAASPQSLARDLGREGWSLVACEQLDEGRTRRLSLKQVLEFTQGLELLFNQGLSIKDAVRVLGTIKTSSVISALAATLEARLAKGQSMAQALAEHAAGFPPLYLGLIRVGELTGTLKTVLPRLSKYLAERKRLRDKALGSLMYPSLILLVLVVGMVLLTTLVLPTFMKVAESLRGQGAGDLRGRLVAFQIAFMTFILAIPAAAGIIIVIRKSGRYRRAFDRFVLTARPIRRAFELTEMQNFCFGLETLLQSGYTIDVALDEAKQVTGNAALVEAIEEVRQKVKKGAKLSTSLAEARLFPPTLCAWVAVGEETHDLRDVFTHLREYYEYEFERLTASVMALLEPGLILFVGGVLFLVIAQFLGPIYRLLGGQQ